MMDDSIRVVLRVRTLGSAGLNPPQIQVIDRLQMLAEDGSIDEFDVDSWGRSMGITQTDNPNPAAKRELVVEFKRWADQHGCTLRPAFSWRSADEASEQKPSAEIITPLITLAVYTGEELQAVYPHANEDEEGVQTVHDGIEALELMTTDAQPTTDNQREIGDLAIPSYEELKQG